MFSKILVPLDGSATSRKAIPYCIEIAKKFDSEIMLLEVVERTPMYTPITSSGIDAIATPRATQIELDAIKIQDRKKTIKARRYLRKKAKEIREQGFKVTFKSLFGDPADTIIQTTRRESIDLVVITSSGKGGLKRAILGSVSDSVIRRQKIPVLVIKPKTK